MRKNEKWQSLDFDENRKPLSEAAFQNAEYKWFVNKMDPAPAHSS